MRSRIHSRWPILGVHGWMWLWMLFLGATAPAQVIISEFVADNVLGLRDEDGQSEDWIEVHNISPAPVDLAGWHLTDSASDLRQWTFPEISIGPGEFMVVHASGKDRRRPDAPLHTTFPPVRLRGIPRARATGWLDRVRLLTRVPAPGSGC
jgi:hypothetical protein